MLSDHATRLLAIAVLASIAVALVILLEADRRHMGVSYAQLPIYMFNQFMTRVRWRARVEGKVQARRGQGAVIVCNHIGPVDPGFIALACDRSVHWMVAREYCKVPLIGLALRILEVIPTGRSGIDTAATKLAIRYAQRGELVGMFPEGRLNDTGRLLLPGRAGAAMVALKARVPVIPCYIEGSPFGGQVFRFFFLSAKTRLKVGRPIDISEFYGTEDREVLKLLTKRFLHEIAMLAGRPDYEPELAGRELKEPSNLAPVASHA